MNQNDWVGDLPPQNPFKDIRSTRPAVAEEKAQLCLELGKLCHTVPAGINSGSIDKAREWMAAQKAAQKAARKIAGNSRASVQELTAAINNMRRFK